MACIISHFIPYLPIYLQVFVHHFSAEKRREQVKSDIAASTASFRYLDLNIILEILLFFYGNSIHLFSYIMTNKYDIDIALKLVAFLVTFAVVLIVKS